MWALGLVLEKSKQIIHYGNRAFCLSHGDGVRVKSQSEKIMMGKLVLIIPVLQLPATSVFVSKPPAVDLARHVDS